MNLDAIIIYLERCLKIGVDIDNLTGEGCVSIDEAKAREIVSSLKEINDLLDRNRINLIQ